MIYKKPQNAMYMLDLVVEGGGVLNWVRDVKAFLHSLPAEFEIVEPGNVQVRWPEGFTRERLKVLVAEAPWQRAGVDDWRCRECLATVFRGIYPTAFGHAAHCSHSIRDVVDRAEKAERRAELWLHVSGQKLWKYPDDNWRLNSTGWRKVGECEVTE